MLDLPLTLGKLTPEKLALSFHNISCIFYPNCISSWSGRFCGRDQFGSAVIVPVFKTGGVMLDSLSQKKRIFSILEESKLPDPIFSFFCIFDMGAWHRPQRKRLFWHLSKIKEMIQKIYIPSMIIL